MSFTGTSLCAEISTKHGLGHLAALYASNDTESAARFLSRIPAGMIADMVEALVDQLRDDQQILLWLVTNFRVAEHVPARVTERALRALAAHSQSLVRERAAVGLERYLLRIRGLTRTEVIAEWATSPHPPLRAAVAKALCNVRIHALGIVPALELLAEDRSAEVRRAAVEATACRLESSPERCSAVLRRHAVGERRSIRLAAVVGLRRTMEMGQDDRAVPVLVSCADTTDVVVAEEAMSALTHGDSNEAIRWMEAMVIRLDELDDRMAASILSTARRVAARYPERAGRILSALRRHRASWLAAEANAALAELC